MYVSSDLAASIVTNKPPSTSLSLPLEDAILNDASPALQSYDECLYCLANSLRLVHHQIIPLLSGFHAPQPQAVGLHSSNWDQWSDLWSACTLWFQARPHGMEPVLESLDEPTRQGRSFPIDVYTSATALQANLVMHMSAIILLAYRPRLGDVAGSSRRLRSRSWHVQKIARMLIGNHFHEQWDPIAISALLFIAREMSHASQQEGLLSCLQEVVRTTQIPIESDVASLRECWRRTHHEGPLDVSQHI
jgi:hypothetical protein